MAMIMNQAGNLLYLIFVFLVLGLYFLHLNLKNRDLKAIGDKNLIHSMLSNVSTGFRHLKFGLLLGALIFGVLALTVPKWGKEFMKVKERGAEVYFILDNSLSMLAEDVHDGEISLKTTGLSRFDLAKKKMKQLIDYLEGNKMGLILAAGNAQLECPLIFNTDLLKNSYLEMATPAPAWVQGTVLANSIQEAMNLFTGGKYIPRIIILFSDGEDHQSRLDEVLNVASKKKIRIYTVGVGSLEGGKIPRRSEYDPVVTYKRDRTGRMVHTRLQEKTLKDIAEKTGGLYITTRNPGAMRSLRESLDGARFDELRESKISVDKDQFQLFVLMASLLFIAGLFLPESKSGLKKLSETMKLPIFIGISFMSLAFSGDMDKGKEFYDLKMYEEAIDEYDLILENESDNAKAYMHRGNSYYRKKAYKKSLRDYEKGLKHSEDTRLKSQFWYNMGQSSYQMGKLDEALKLYKKSIQADSKNDKAKHNYYVLKKMMERSNQQGSMSGREGGRGGQDSRKGNRPGDQRNNQRGNNENPGKNPGDRSGDDGSKDGGPGGDRENDLSTEDDPRGQSMDDKLNELLRRDRENRSRLNGSGKNNRGKFFRRHRKDW